MGMLTAPKAAAAVGRAERLILTATFVTWLGTSIHATASALLLIRTEHTSASVGWLFIMVAAPQALLSYTFGRLADRLDRRTLCVACDLVSFVAALALPIALAAGADISQAVYVTSFILASIFAMYVPAVSALIKERVAADRLPRFSGNFEIAVQSGTLLSTAIGGFAVQLVGTTPVFIFNAFTYLVSGLLLFTIRRRSAAVTPVPAATPVPAVTPAPAAPLTPAAAAEPTAPDGPGEPGKAAAQSAPAPVARIGILYALGGGILTVTNTLIVVLVIQTYAQGAAVLGVVDSLAGVGVLLAAVLYRWATTRFDQLWIAVTGYLGCAALVVLYPMFGIVALAFLYTAGSAGFGIGRVAARTMLLTATTDQNVGRVFGTTNAAGLAFSVVATLAITYVTDRAGIEIGYAMFAAVIAGVTIVAAATLRSADHRFPPLLPEGAR